MDDRLRHQRDQALLAEDDVPGSAQNRPSFSITGASS
jgi:hypothetical protein